MGHILAFLRQKCSFLRQKCSFLRQEYEFLRHLFIFVDKGGHFWDKNSLFETKIIIFQIEIVIFEIKVVIFKSKMVKFEIKFLIFEKNSKMPNILKKIVKILIFGQKVELCAGVEKWLKNYTFYIYRERGLSPRQKSKGSLSPGMFLFQLT